MVVLLLLLLLLLFQRLPRGLDGGKLDTVREFEVSCIGFVISSWGFA